MKNKTREDVEKAAKLLNSASIPYPVYCALDGKMYRLDSEDVEAVFMYEVL